MNEAKQILLQTNKMQNNKENKGKYCCCCCHFLESQIRRNKKVFLLLLYNLKNKEKPQCPLEQKVNAIKYLSHVCPIKYLS